MVVSTLGERWVVVSTSGSTEVKPKITIDGFHRDKDEDDSASMDHGNQITRLFQKKKSNHSELSPRVVKT
jgi:hypothetical protein